jgi:hypothetical protein
MLESPFWFKDGGFGLVGPETGIADVVVETGAALKVIRDGWFEGF